MSENPALTTVVTSQKGHVGWSGIWSALRHTLFPLVSGIIDAIVQVVYESFTAGSFTIPFSTLKHASIVALGAGLLRLWQRYKATLTVDIPSKEMLQ